MLLPLIQAWGGWHFPGTICKVVKKKKEEEEDPGGNLEEEYQHVRNAQKNRIIPKRLKNGQRSRKTSRKAKAEFSYRRRQ